MVVIQSREFVLIIVIVILILYQYKNKVNEYFTMDYIKSTYDLRYYKVNTTFSDKYEAANMLAKLHEFMIRFIKFIKIKFVIKKQGTPYQIAFFNRVLYNYNIDNIFENTPSPGSETSFVTDKGVEFGICLRQKEIYGDKIHDIQILQFVMLHELTHLGCISYGHDKEFWDSFAMVLKNAVESGLYEPVDYKKNNVNYCGVTVSNNPYYEKKYNVI